MTSGAIERVSHRRPARSSPWQAAMPQASRISSWFFPLFPVNASNEVDSLTIRAHRGKSRGKSREANQEILRTRVIPLAGHLWVPYRESRTPKKCGKLESILSAKPISWVSQISTVKLGAFNRCHEQPRSEE